jgi:hypothetical protein
MNAAVMPFHCADDEFDQPSELEELDIQPATPWARDLCKQPTQLHPDIEQDEAQGEQQKAIGRGR